MTQTTWTDVDLYLEGLLLSPDPALKAALAANAAAGLPPHDVSPCQGKLLHLLARLSGARRILEIGTLGGYSTIWLARSLPPGGLVVTLEVNPAHAEVARANIARASLADAVSIVTGPALGTLTTMQEEGCAPFDFIFIDADKPSNAAYFAAALKLSRPGTVIVADNVVRDGGLLDDSGADASVAGVRRFLEAVAREPRVSATAIQTVGMKGHDGFAIMRVS